MDPSDFSWWENAVRVSLSFQIGENLDTELKLAESTVVLRRRTRETDPLVSVLDW